VAIDDGLIRAGSRTAAFDRTQPETLLRNYLRLVRRARSQQRDPEISLRREDIDALAEYLGVPAESVLNRLATLMGSSRTQRTTMLAAFASGALLVGLAGSAAATSPLLDTSSPSLGDPAPATVARESSIESPVPQVLASETDRSETGTASSAPASVSTRRSTVVTGNSGADRLEVTESEPTDAVGTPPSARTGSTVANNPSADDNRRDLEDDVAVSTPVAPDLDDSVAVGDAVVPPSGPTPGNGPVEGPVDVAVAEPPTVTTTVPIDEVPQELPLVDEDSVAVGPPPVPPTTPVTTAPAAPPATAPVDPPAPVDPGS